MKPILETQRLLLREMSLADLDFVAPMLAHPEVMQFFPKCCSREESEDWVRRQEDRYERHGHGYWLVLEKETEQPVGQAGVLMVHVDGVEEPGLGWMIHHPFWGMGFATEAAAGCRDYTFGTLDRWRLITLIRPENVPSQNVALKIGMKEERSVQFGGFEHLLYSVSRSADES
jgi:ribosomal-protein-alanine N-acetyltransferase